MVEAHKGVLVQRFVDHSLAPCTARGAGLNRVSTPHLACSDVPTIEFILWKDEQSPPECVATT